MLNRKPSAPPVNDNNSSATFTTTSPLLLVWDSIIPRCFLAAESSILDALKCVMFNVTRERARKSPFGRGSRLALRTPTCAEVENSG